MDNQRKGITIKEYLDKDIMQETRQVLEYLIKNKYSLDYKPSYNTITFGYLFLNWNLSPDDFIFICNKYSNIISTGLYEHVDNHRLSINSISKEYRTSKDKGCCGSFDSAFFNPFTNNQIYIGFNYGH